MSLATQQTYMSSLFTASAVLAAKMGVIHLLTVRSRLMSGTLAQPFDKLGTFVSKVFKVVFCCYGSDLGGVAMVERAERIAKNCAENEPFFLSLATAAGLSGVVPFGLGIQFLHAYTAFRCLHTGVYILGDKLSTLCRAGAWTGGLGCMFGLAISGVKGCKGNTTA